MLRRFAGPQAHELSLLCRPTGDRADASWQAEDAYRQLAALLRAEKASFEDVACETLLVRDVQRDLAAILDVRGRVLAELGLDSVAPLPRFIQQPPLAPGAAFELVASAVVPQTGTRSVRNVRAAPSCPCEGCTRSGARVLRAGDRTLLTTTNLYGTGHDTFEQARNAFGAAETLLRQCGMEFGDVVRIWIHLRDIGRDYAALNRARRDFFQRRGITRLPASTGVQGGPFPRAHDVTVSVAALRSSGSLDVAPVSTPTLNEASSYGADFSRGLRLADRNSVTLLVSGTASIDEQGRTIHAGDVTAQAERMLHNVATLLAQHGAGFADVISGVTYVKHATDAPAVRALCRARGYDGFPCALVEASLCRPDLLCETEAVAIRPAEA
ncbi:MAG TPA: RidA family protein [Candidatus Limnocylindria bacterium]|nr:RidA family protein [Candidatus Limnocylindria bacterium]